MFTREAKMREKTRSGLHWAAEGSLLQGCKEGLWEASVPLGKTFGVPACLKFSLHQQTAWT